MPTPRSTTQHPKTVALLLAGGRGSRLSPLTDTRSKPAVPFAGNYRIIDIALSNLAHSGLRDVWVVEQYRPFSLNQHLAGGRPWDLDGTQHGLRILPPSEGREEAGFASGNGHALHQQIPLLEQVGADTVMVLSADHLYRMDFQPALEQHRKLGSDLTIVTTTVDEEPTRYGVVQVNKDGVVEDYDYKPDNPKGRLIATEVFIFNLKSLKEATDYLVEKFKAEEAADEPDGAGLGDYGETIIPHLVAQGKVHEYRLTGYWKDIGTIDAFYRAHMELIEGTGFELAAEDWPIITHPQHYSPALIAPSASVSASLISPGAVVRGTVEHSVIGPGVTVEAGASVSRSIIMGETLIPAGAHLESTIVDVAATVPAEKIGETKPGPGNITILT